MLALSMPVTSYVIMREQNKNNKQQKGGGNKRNTLESLLSCIYGSVDLYESNNCITRETDELLKSEAKKKGEENTTGIITITCV